VRASSIKQIAVFGVHRSRGERDRLQDREINALRLDYGHKARSFEALPTLSDKVQHFMLYPRRNRLNSFTAVCHSNPVHCLARSVR
jgi:hypothetical protein